MVFHAVILLGAQDKLRAKDWLHTAQSRLGSRIYILTLTQLWPDFLVKKSKEG